MDCAADLAIYEDEDRIDPNKRRARFLIVRLSTTEKRSVHCLDREILESPSETHLPVA